MFSLSSLLPPKNLFILQNIPFSFPSHVVTVRTTTFSPMTQATGHWLIWLWTSDPRKAKELSS